MAASSEGIASWSLSAGRRAAEAHLRDSNGRLLAHATTTCLVFDIPLPKAA